MNPESVTIITGISLFFRGTALLCLCWLGHFLIRRKSGCLSNRLWQMGHLGLLGVTLLFLFAPPLAFLGVSMLPSRAAKLKPIEEIKNEIYPEAGASLVPRSLVQASDVPAKVESNHRSTLPILLISLWGTGGVLVLGMYVLSWCRLRNIRTEAPPAGSAWDRLASDCSRKLRMNWVGSVLVHPKASAPFGFGILRPAIVLPEGSDEWPEHQKRAVLLHEMAHVMNGDLVFQAVAVVAKAIHWMNPLSWISTRALRQAAELHADERVLKAGIPPADYAAVLHAFASSDPRFVGGGLGLSMATQVSDVEGRVRTLLSKPVTSFRWGFVAVILCLLCIAAVVIGGIALGRGPATVNGTVEVYEATIAPAESGVLLALAPGIAIGQSVSKGQIVAQLDTSLIDLEIQRFLEQQRVNGEDEMAGSGQSSLELELSVADQRQLEILKLRKERSTLRAFCDGVVDEIGKEPGEFVDQGEFVVKIVAKPQMIRGFLPEDQIKSVKKGDTVWVSSRIDQRSIFEAQVLDLSPRIDTVRDSQSPLPNQVIRGRSIILDYPRGCGLISGQSVIIYVVDPSAS